MLRCIACKRPLAKPAATIERAGLTGNFGPKCAANAGLFTALAKAVKRPLRPLSARKTTARRKDDRQMPLDLEVQHEAA